MTYQVLARKWRPQDFSSIVGQEPIITALSNGLRDGRIAQAYLFSGIRGVGKTTAARVLAKALNCERAQDERPTGDPCNECPPCIDITAGTDMDVLEVDAATYSKVEQVRELTESLRYTPARDRFKVVVLDEVHRLSRQAFDALLKIVEEPPAHLVFIFATTENDAVPATILSRCQEFQFRRVPSPVLAKHLRRISDAENIEVSDAALRLISRAGEGSVRDSVALLDQLATFGNSTISDHDASKLLGGLDAAIFLGVLGAILEGDPAVVTRTVRDVEANGWDPHNVFGQFLVYARDALHLAVGGKPENVDLPLEEAQALADLVQSHRYENLLRLSDHLLMSEPIVRRSEFALLALEIAWLRAAELPKLTRIEDLLSGATPAPPVKPEASQPKREPRPHPPSRSEPAPKRPSTNQPESRARAANPPRANDPPPPRATDPPPAEAAAATARTRPSGSSARQIEAFRDLLNSRRQPLAGHFEPAKLIFDDGKLLIHPPPGDPLMANALKRENNAKLVDELVQQVWGTGATWTVEAAPPAKPDRVADTAESAAEDEVVQTVLEVFGGNIQSVQNPKDQQTKP